MGCGCLVAALVLGPLGLGAAILAGVAAGFCEDANTHAECADERATAQLVLWLALGGIALALVIGFVLLIKGSADDDDPPFSGDLST